MTTAPNTQLALTGAGVPAFLCGHVELEASDRVGRYRLVCTRRTHDDNTPHELTWLTDLRPVVPVAPRAEVL